MAIKIETSENSDASRAGGKAFHARTLYTAVTPSRMTREQVADYVAGNCHDTRNVSTGELNVSIDLGRDVRLASTLERLVDEVVEWLEEMGAIVVETGL